MIFSPLGGVKELKYLAHQDYHIFVMSLIVRWLKWPLNSQCAFALKPSGKCGIFMHLN